MIIEWNAHMFSSDQVRYPFYKGASYIPPPERHLPDPLAAYLERMKALGIDRAVIVHPEPYGDDHRLILDCLARERKLIKGTCLFLPRDPQAVKKMEALIEREPRLIALRFHAVQKGKGFYFDSFAEESVRRLWRRAGELGLAIELHIGPAFAAQAAEALREYPDFPVLIDHLAEPGAGTAEEYEEVLALSRFSHVYMKISGLNHFSQEPEPYLDAKPLVRRVAAAFGPERLVWGSGSPSIIDAHLDDFSAAERAKVKGGNLATLLGFA